MEYRTLGKTGLRVSILGYGASPLGGEFGPIDEDEGVRAVHAAVDAGINFFDVSPYYGRTRAETVLGRALRTISRDRYLVATKVGRYDKSEFDFSAARTLRSVDESLQRLGVDHVDLIQCHDIEFGSLDQVVQETLPALEKLRQAGKARFFGITGLPLKIFAYVLDRADVDTVLSYCRYNLYDRSLETIMPYLQSKQVGIINASPLAMGLLTDGPLQEWHPASEQIRSTCAAAATLCRERGAQIADLALQFALADTRIATTLVGMATREYLQRNLANVGVPPDPGLLAAVEKVLAPIRDRSWPSGRPENNESNQ